MGLMARVVGVTVASALVVAGGYVWADAHDIVPGVLTLGPEPAPPAPFPTAPGADTGPDPADTLSVLDPEALAPDPAVLQQRVDALVADPRLGPSVGVVVSDTLTGDVLASADPDRPRTPASIQKVLTATAALSALGPDHVLETTVVRTGEGTIALVGGGDMMLAAGAGDADAVNGHAGMADLAAQVAKELALAGRTTVTLTLDDTLFTGDPMGPWSPDQPTLGYAAPVAAVAVDTGRTGPGIYAQRHADPAMVAAQELARALAAEGITVEGEPTRAAAAADARVIGTVQSAPLGEIVEYLLQTSDNTITEVVARTVAVDAGMPASFAGSTKAVLAELATLGLDVSDAVLVDASGLGAGSSVPASLFAEVLELVSDPANVELRAAATDLPVSGLQGTLAERFLSSPARGLVRAKTGSLPQVTSLAGTVVTADGRLLTFVVMADQTPEGGQWAPRQAIDGFVTDLALCGCR